ncbi:MAG: hypothetical protein OCD76_18505 [Reichenbachiella sp.]
MIDGHSKITVTYDKVIHHQVAIVLAHPKVTDEYQYIIADHDEIVPDHSKMIHGHSKMTDGQI